MMGYNRGESIRDNDECEMCVNVGDMGANTVGMHCLCELLITEI